MRPVPVRTREEPEEGGWIITAAENVINPVFSEKRLNNGTEKKTQEVSSLKAEPFEASKIL
jgi:hypothetical protein